MSIIYTIKTERNTVSANNTHAIVDYGPEDRKGSGDRQKPVLQKSAAEKKQEPCERCADPTLSKVIDCSFCSTDYLWFVGLMNH